MEHNKTLFLFICNSHHSGKHLSLIPNRIRSKHSYSWDLGYPHMVLILAIGQFWAITERILSVLMIHGNFVFPFALAVILKQKCQCLLKKKFNFFGYNYASITKKGHVPTTYTVVKSFITTPVVTLSIGGHKEHFSKLERVRGWKLSFMPKTQNDSL